MTLLLFSFRCGMAMPVPKQMHQRAGHNQQVWRGGRPYIAAVVPEQVVNDRRDREHGGKPKPGTEKALEGNHWRLLCAAAA